MQSVGVYTPPPVILFVFPRRCGTTERHARRGFTLIELLAVISIISLLLVSVAPLIRQIAYGGTFNQALIQVSGSLEQARAYAVANNTYTYVVFATDSSQNLYCSIIGSADGTSGINASLTQSGTYKVCTPGTTSDANPLAVLSTVTKIGPVRLEDAIPPAPKNNLKQKNPMLANGSVPLSNGTAKFVCPGLAGPIGSLTFTRAVQFTPEGAARVDRFLPQAVNLVLVPVKGDSLNGVDDPAAASAVWVTGLTGQVTVFRP